MKKSLFFLITGVILILLGGYLYSQLNPQLLSDFIQAPANPQPEAPNPLLSDFTSPGESAYNCTDTSNCVLPMDYAIRSNCPFQAACIDDICQVICPMWEHSPNPEQSISYQVACFEDSACDCSGWDSQNQYPCKCVNGQCASVVDTAEKPEFNQIPGQYYEDDKIKIKYPENYSVISERPDFVDIVAEDGGKISFYEGTGERSVSFDFEEGPVGSDFIVIKIASGEVRNNNKINEYFFENRGYSVPNAKGLIFFYIESPSTEGKFVDVNVEYTSDEQKSALLEMLKTLEIK